MNQLLVWPLADHCKISFVAKEATLSNITCKDSLHIIFQHHEQQYELLVNITGCALESLRNLLLSFVGNNGQTGRFQDAIIFNSDQFGNCLIDIRQNHKPFFYALVTPDVLHSWAKQLELLHVVMEENENEKNDRGTGCCGL